MSSRRYNRETLYIYIYLLFMFVCRWP